MNKLMKLLEKEQLDDVLIQGYLESDELIPKFNAMLDKVHLVFGDEYIDIVNDTYNQSMSLELSDKIEAGFEVDEDDQFAISSYFSLLLVDTVSDIRISQIDIYKSEVEDNYVKCQALNLCFSNGESLFVDSSYYDGLKLGGESLKNRFNDENPDTICESIKLEN